MAKSNNGGGAAAAKKGVAETAVYLVGDTPVRYDGERYEPGSSIELTEAEADRLGLKLAPADSKE